MNTITFESLKLIDPLLKALHQEGYFTPTPIQSQAIPFVLEAKDLLGVAQTGTGKTAAFALPILQRMSETKAARNNTIRTLVLTPTRELAAQIAESFERYGKNLGHRVTVIFGGVGQGAQVRALRSGVEILVATPGRLLDLIDQRHIDLSGLEIFVLDEADRMLDMGFIHDVRRVIKLLPRKRQSLFFSATMPADIQRLANDILTQPIRVEVTPVATTAEKIEQSVYFVDTANKRRLLEHLMQDPSLSRSLVFTRTKHGADKVARFLDQAGIAAEAIHGNKSQNNRVRALNNFKSGTTRVLVATDIAARGIDIDGVSHVINYDLPNVPESYVHRIGRTARAGAEGVSISFCDTEERAYLRDIEKTIRMKVPVVSDHPFPPGSAAPAARAAGSGARTAGRNNQEHTGGRTHPSRPHHARNEGPRAPRPAGRAQQSARPAHQRGEGGSAAHAGQRGPRPEGSGRNDGPRQGGGSARGGERPRSGGGERSRGGGSRNAPGGGSRNASGGGKTQGAAQGSRREGARRPSGGGGGGGRGPQASGRREESASGSGSNADKKKSWWKRLTRS